MCSPSVQNVRKRRPQSRNDDEEETKKQSSSVDGEIIRSSSSSSFRSHPQTTTTTTSLLSSSPLQTTEHNTAATRHLIVSSLTERIWQLDHLLCGQWTTEDQEEDHNKTTATALPQPAEQQICSILRDDIPEWLNQAFSMLALQEESDDSSQVNSNVWMGTTLLQLLSVLSHSWFFLDDDSTSSKNHITKEARQLAQSMIPRLIHEFVLHPQYSEFVVSQLLMSSSMEQSSENEHGQEQAEGIAVSEASSSIQLHHHHHPSQLYHRLVGVFLHVCDNDNDDSHYSDLSSALLSALTLGNSNSNNELQLLQHKLSLPEVYYLLQRTLPTALEQLNNHSSFMMTMQDPNPKEDNFSSPAAPPSQIQIPATNPPSSGQQGLLEHTVPEAVPPAASPMTNDHGLLLLEQPPNDGASATPHKNQDWRLVQWMVQLQICLLDRMISSSSSSSIWKELQASIGGSIDFELEQDYSYEEQQDALQRQTQHELLELGQTLWQSALVSTTTTTKHSSHHQDNWMTLLTLATDLWHAQCHAASLFLVETTETDSSASRRLLQHKNMMDDSKQLAQQAWEQWVTKLLLQQPQPQHYPNDTTTTLLWKLTKLVVLNGRGDHTHMNMQIMTDDEPQQRRLAYALVTCAPIWLDDDEHEEQTQTMILTMMMHPSIWMRRALLALAWTSSVSHTHLRPEHGERLMHWIRSSSSSSRHIHMDPFTDLFFAQAPWRQYVIQPQQEQQQQQQQDGDDDDQQQPMSMHHDSLDVDDTTLMDVSSSSPAADDVVEKEHHSNNSGSPSDPMMVTMMELSPQEHEQEQSFPTMMMQE